MQAIKMTPCYVKLQRLDENLMELYTRKYEHLETRGKTNKNGENAGREDPNKDTRQRSKNEKKKNSKELLNMSWGKEKQSRSETWNDPIVTQESSRSFGESLNDRVGCKESSLYCIRMEKKVKASSSAMFDEEMMGSMGKAVGHESFQIWTGFPDGKIGNVRRKTEKTQKDNVNFANSNFSVSSSKSGKNHGSFQGMTRPKLTDETDGPDNENSHNHHAGERVKLEFHEEFDICSENDCEDDKQTVIFDESLFVELNDRQAALNEVTEFCEMKKNTINSRGKRQRKKKVSGRKSLKRKSTKNSKGKITETKPGKEEEERSTETENIEDVLKEVCDLVKQLHRTHQVILHLKNDMENNAGFADHFKTVIATQQEKFKKDIWKNQEKIMKVYDKMMATYKNPSEVTTEISKRTLLSREDVDDMILKCIIVEETRERQKEKGPETENKEIQVTGTGGLFTENEIPARDFLSEKIEETRSVTTDFSDAKQGEPFFSPVTCTSLDGPPGKNPFVDHRLNGFDGHPCKIADSPSFVGRENECMLSKERYFSAAGTISSDSRKKTRYGKLNDDRESGQHLWGFSQNADRRIPKISVNSSSVLGLPVDSAAAAEYPDRVREKASLRFAFVKDAHAPGRSLTLNVPVGRTDRVTCSTPFPMTIKESFDPKNTFSDRSSSFTSSSSAFFPVRFKNNSPDFPSAGYSRGDFKIYPTDRVPDFEGSLSDQREPRDDPGSSLIRENVDEKFFKGGFHRARSSGLPPSDISQPMIKICKWGPDLGYGNVGRESVDGTDVGRSKNDDDSLDPTVPQKLMFKNKRFQAGPVLKSEKEGEGESERQMMMMMNDVFYDFRHRQKGRNGSGSDLGVYV